MILFSRRQRTTCSRPVYLQLALNMSLFSDAAKRGKCIIIDDLPVICAKICPTCSTHCAIHLVQRAHMTSCALAKYNRLLRRWHTVRSRWSADGQYYWRTLGSPLTPRGAATAPAMSVLNTATTSLRRCGLLSQCQYIQSSQIKLACKDSKTLRSKEQDAIKYAAR